MAVALKIPDNIFPVKGIRLAAVSAGIYTQSRNDLSLIEISEGSRVAAVFTKNSFCAAPVILSQKHLEICTPRYLLINAGNANAGTGKSGLVNARITCENLATLASVKTEEVLAFSTGVIGEHLPVEKINNELPKLYRQLSTERWLDVALAIMTTDTIPKVCSRKILIANQEVTITGIAKGSGMIHPNMATMLSFIATDANLDKKLLKKLLMDAVSNSFNRITVDGDTSTNDSCVLIATGQAKNSTISDRDTLEIDKFHNALTEIFVWLAQAIVRDGEGATKFVEIEVADGANKKDCLKVAYSIANSLLVKTALTASDPNWGRILAAVGNAGVEKINIDSVSIYLEGVCIVKKGQKTSTYTNHVGKEFFLKEEIKIMINLGMGGAKETVWTTDLSSEYIKINAEYRT